MADIIVVADLPSDVQSHELVAAMVAGANAKASRVAPCLVAPTSTAWAAATAYAVGDLVRLASTEFIEATIAGTSGATVPTVPDALDGTVADGLVTWKRVAPTFDQSVEAKLVLIGAVKRWADAGSGALASQTAGPFGQTLDTRQRTGYHLWPSEITDLQGICSAGQPGRQAFSIDTAPACSAHLPWCSLMLGATYCSCGVDIAGYPIYELG